MESGTRGLEQLGSRGARAEALKADRVLGGDGEPTRNPVPPCLACGTLAEHSEDARIYITRRGCVYVCVFVRVRAHVHTICIMGFTNTLH